MPDSEADVGQNLDVESGLPLSGHADPEDAPKAPEDKNCAGATTPDKTTDVDLGIDAPLEKKLESWKEFLANTMHGMFDEYGKGGKKPGGQGGAVPTAACLRTC